MPLLYPFSKRRLTALAVFLLPLSALASASPQTGVLDLDSATKAIEAASHISTLHSDKVAISIVDNGGHLIYFSRPAGVPSGMGDAATKKAQTAAGYGLSTQVLEDAVAHGNTSYLALPGILPLRGGLPVRVNGQLTGAVGVAGSDSDSDAALAQAIAEALSH